MRLLMTNNTLSARAGTELYVRDVALRLRELGHEVVCFTFDQGEVAEEIRAGGVQVVSSLARNLGPFDLIHGHHRFETMLAAMAFPEVPVLSICHSPSERIWQDAPSFFPNIVQYAAVDIACRDRLVKIGGLPEGEIPLLLNFADTRRFQSRGPLPAQPRTALVFSNYAHETTHLPALRQACEERGITLDAVGQAVGRVVERPEDLLPSYDLVFAKGRAAIEAMVTGCAVILADFFGVGPLITSDQLDYLRPLSFGHLAASESFSVELIAEQIHHYDAADAAEVSRRMRSEASLDGYMTGLLAVYEKAIAKPVPRFDPWEKGELLIRELVSLAKDAKNRLPVFEQMVNGSQAEILKLHGHLRDAEEIIRLEREKVATLRAKKTGLQKKMQVLVEKNQKLKDEFNLKQGHQKWWRKWFSR